MQQLNHQTGGTLIIVLSLLVIIGIGAMAMMSGSVLEFRSSVTDSAAIQTNNNAERSVEMAEFKIREAIESLDEVGKVTGQEIAASDFIEDFSTRPKTLPGQENVDWGDDTLVQVAEFQSTEGVHQSLATNKQGEARYKIYYLKSVVTGGEEGGVGTGSGTGITTNSHYFRVVTFAEGASQSESTIVSTYRYDYVKDSD